MNLSSRVTKLNNANKNTICYMTSRSMAKKFRAKDYIRAFDILRVNSASSAPLR
jgi:hypothetical protein